MADDLSILNQQVKKNAAELALLKAQLVAGRPTASPWFPLKEASTKLNFTSPRALRNRIQGGHFPPDCFRVDPTFSGGSVRYLINVERYVRKLG
jgi:hypothetical protein